MTNADDTPNSPVPIREQLLRALDPDGTMRRDMAAARALPASHCSREVRRLAQEYDDRLDAMERHWEALTDRGWGVANVGVDLISRAGDYLSKGEGEAADETIMVWFDTRWMSRTVARVAFIMDGTAKGRGLFEQRARLLRDAQRHHEHGDFAASIMTVLAQVEGITAQVTAPTDGGQGKLFFTKRDGRKADVVEPSDLASIEASLDRLRDVYSAGVPVAQAAGDLSRHGIVHGQELAFDTRINSAKCWSLLDVLVQWAMPRGRERDLRVAGQRQSAHVGSSDLDEHGRRFDDREFKVSRNALYEVCAKQSSYARRAQRFDPSWTAPEITDEAMSKRGLPTPHGIAVFVGPGGLSFWAVRRTVSGWWLGRALTLNRDGFVDVWYYSGADEPAHGPLDDPALWGGRPNEAPPDWWGGDV